MPEQKLDLREALVQDIEPTELHLYIEWQFRRGLSTDKIPDVVAHKYGYSHDLAVKLVNEHFEMTDFGA